MAGVPAAVSVPPSNSPPASTPRLSISDEGVVLRASVQADRWMVRGTAKVEGNVEVGELDVLGLLSVRGKLTVGQGQVSGRAELDGLTEVLGSLRLQGTHHLGSGLTAGELWVKGDCEVNGGVTVRGGFVSEGKLEVHGSVHANTLEFDGRLVANEWIAERIHGRLREGSSRATTIRAPVVQILRGGWRGPSATLEADRIEGREVVLENVVCEYVWAERVTVGPGCHLAKVDGTIVRKDGHSVVGYESRSFPPPWLSR